MSGTSDTSIESGGSLGRDAETGVYRARYDRSEPATTAIVIHVAAANECDPLDLPPLANAVDPDALDRVFSGETLAGRVSFMYADCEVTLRSDGRIRIVP